MNPDSNNFNQNNLNSQGNNGVPNNQPLNNNEVQNFNNTVNQNVELNFGGNQQTVAPTPNPQISNQSNGFQSNNQSYMNLEYATFGNRLVALLKDCLYSWWIALVGFFAIFIIKAILQTTELVDNVVIDVLTVLQVSGPILFILLGQPLCAMVGDVSKKHASKSKYKQNICVLDKNGNYLSIGQSFLRMLLKYITLAVPFGLIITIIVMCCTKKKQALHDLVLGHVVVKNADRIHNANEPKQNSALIALAIIGAIVVGFVVLFLTIFIGTSTKSNKLVCKSSEGNITIMYNESGITGYVSNGMSYDLDAQKEVATEIGMDAYITEFNSWFKSNTSGYCTINGEKVSEENIVEEDSNNENTTVVGDNKYGYITIPKNWARFYDVDGNTSLQYSYANVYIVSLNY